LHGNLGVLASAGFAAALLLVGLVASLTVGLVAAFLFDNLVIL
jgi:hypothetical protein